MFGGEEALERHPGIKFGRYSDAYKEATQYDAWDLALEKFEQKEYLDAYEAFLKYLLDESEANVRWERKQDKLNFEIIQGSKKINGIADVEKLKVEVKLAIVDQLNIGFMRRLMELNFDLKYGRYALDNNKDIAMKFDTYVLDGSPYKLYYALKEVATKADKLDDILIDEFQMLHATDTSLQQIIPESEKIVKYNYIINEIKLTFKELDEGRLNAEQYPGGVGYLLLSLTYKFDYLIQPEGFMMETLERIHRLYFAKDERKMVEKNQTLRKEFQKLLDRPKEDFFKEMYRVNSTFGITVPVNQDRIRNFIDAELYHMNWYIEQGYDRYALAIPGIYCRLLFVLLCLAKAGARIFRLVLQGSLNLLFLSNWAFHRIIGVVLKAVLSKK